MNPRCVLSTFTILVSFSAGTRADDAPPRKSPPAEPPAVRGLSFSPDGSLLSAAVADKGRGGTVLIWDVANRKLTGAYHRAGELPAAAFSFDGESIVVAGGAKSLAVLDARSGTKSGEIGPLPAEVVALQPAGAGRWVTLGKDNAFRIWDVAGKKVTNEFAGPKQVWSWLVSPSGKWLFVNGDNMDRVWDLSSGEELKGTFKPGRGTADVAAFLAEERLVLGSNSGSHRVVELPSGQVLLRFRNEGGTGALAYSPTAGVLACRYYSSSYVDLTPFTLRPPRDAEKTRLAELLKACDSDDYATREAAAAELAKLSSAVEPLLRQAMTDGPSAEVRMRARLGREAILNKPKHRLAGHTDHVRPLAFSPDGKLLATGAADGLVILWDPASGKELVRFVAAPNSNAREK